MHRDREGPENPVLSPEGEQGPFQDFLSWPLFPNQYMGEWGKGEAERASGGLASGIQPVVPMPRAPKAL